MGKEKIDYTKKLKEWGLKMRRTNILIEWVELEAGSIQLQSHTKEYEEAKINQVCKVLAVGDEITGIEPGDYVLMGGAGRLITLDDKVYGIIKEHMVDSVFSGKLPKIGRDEGASQGSITTKLTEQQLDKFSQKHKYPN
jgi:hypothetical protein